MLNVEKKKSFCGFGLPNCKSMLLRLVESLPARSSQVLQINKKQQNKIQLNFNPPKVTKGGRGQ